MHTQSLKYQISAGEGGASTHREQNHFELSGMVTAALGEKTKPGHKCVFIRAEMKISNNCHISRGNPVEQKLSPSACCMIAPCCSQNGHFFQVPFIGCLKFIHEIDLWNSVQLKSLLLPFNLPHLKALLSACEVLLLAILHPCNFLMSSNYAALSRYASGITHSLTYSLTMYKLKTKSYFQY